MGREEAAQAGGAGRARLVVAAVRRFWAVSRPMTAAWFVLSVVGPLLHLAVTVASGRLVGAIPGAVGAGAGSPGGRRLTSALVLMGLLTMLGPLVDSVRWRAADLLGHRFRADQRQRVMAAFLGRAEADSAADPAVQDGAAAADNTWLPSLPEGLMSVGALRVSGFGAAAIVGWHEPIGAVALAAAWAMAGRWKWRRATADAAANLGQVPELRRSAATAELATSPAAAKEVRLFGLGDWLGARFAREWHEAMTEIWRLRRGGAGAAVAVFTALVATHVLVLVRVGAAAADGRLGLGALAVALQAVLATRGIGGVGYGHQEIEYGLQAVPAVERLEAMLAATPDLAGDRPPPEPVTAIRVEGVRYRYPRTDRDVLAGVDLEIPVGTSVAIVGDNGAGKSTLVTLLARLHDPTAGRITVDGTDLATVDPRAWQRSVAAVSQHALRLPLSARENVAGGRPAPDGVLDRAAVDAGAADVVGSFPAGWDTPLSREFTGGVELSGGQWQRLALARALAALEAGAQVLVLDEPTAHLDVRAEAELYDHFLRITRGRTTILVSHRFSTVRRADRIAVLDRGRVVEQGSHEELMALKGRYAAMFTLQASRFTEGVAR